MDSVSSVKQKLRGPEWAQARKRAIASLDPVCVLCHKYIDIQLPRKDPQTGAWNDLAVEVDHKLPRARGGSLYELENLQLTHSRCNRKKGAKMDSDYSGLKVENPVPLSNNW